MTMSRPAVERIEDLSTYRRAYVTPAQLADYVQVSRRMIYKHIEKGALKARRIGNVVRIKRRDALVYAEGSDSVKN